MRPTHASLKTADTEAIYSGPNQDYPGKEKTQHAVVSGDTGEVLAPICLK